MIPRVPQASPLHASRIARGMAGAALIGALVASGCASTQGLAPQQRMRDANSLSSARSLAPLGLSAAAFPAQDWWNAFGDPQLDQLIRAALRDNPTLAAADARLRQAQAQAGLADAARTPTLGASAQYAGVQVPQTLASPPLGGKLQASDVLVLDFKWAPDIWGGQRAQYEAAVGQARAAEVDAQAARLALSANIARSYIALAQAHEARDVASREQARATQLAALGQQRVRAGLDNQLQLRQAESARASARQQVQAAQQQIDALRNALAALLGQGPDRGLDIARPQLLQAPAPGLPEVLPSELLGHRPDVVAARWRVEAASRGIDAGKAAFKPSVNLNALVGLAAAGLSDLFGSDAVLGFGGPAISLPIFDGGRLRSNLAKSHADYDFAVAVYHQALVGALHEVADALQAARALDAQLLAATQARAAAQAAWTLAQARYRAGLGTRLDVLAAQRPLLQLDQQLAALRAQRHAAAVDLDRALGGGLALHAPGNTAPPSPDIATVATP